MKPKTATECGDSFKLPMNVRYDWEHSIDQLVCGYARESSRELKRGLSTEELELLS